MFAFFVWITVGAFLGSHYGAAGQPNARPDINSSDGSRNSYNYFYQQSYNTRPEVTFSASSNSRPIMINVPQPPSNIRPNINNAGGSPSNSYNYFYEHSYTIRPDNTITGSSNGRPFVIKVPPPSNMRPNINNAGGSNPNTYNYFYEHKYTITPDNNNAGGSNGGPLVVNFNQSPSSNTRPEIIFTNGSTPGSYNYYYEETYNTRPGSNNAGGSNVRPMVINSTPQRPSNTRPVNNYPNVVYERPIPQRPVPPPSNTSPVNKYPDVFNEWPPDTPSSNTRPGNNYPNTFNERPIQQPTVPPPPTTSQGCVIPDPPLNRQFSRYNCQGQSSSCTRSPGAFVPHSELVSVTCTPGYFMLQGLNNFATTALSNCQNGKWEPSINECNKVCRPLQSLSLQLECWQGPTLVRCDEPMLPGTVVQYSCKEYYYTNDKFQLNSMRCSPNGEWSRELPYCAPKCGVSNLNQFTVQPAIVGGTTPEAGNLPWHTIIYHKNRQNSWDFKCGGTLISAGAVLTAAHCVTLPCSGCKSPPMNPSEVMVMLGKMYRDWKTKEGSAVQRAVKEIRVHQEYVGSSLNYGQDIAVLILDSEVELNIYVTPACVDYSYAYSNQMIKEKALMGFVAGWGNTEECSSFGNVCTSLSDILKYGRTAIIDFQTCFAASQAIKWFSVSRLTSDKFCSAGNGSDSVVQLGDSGGGLTFEFGGYHFVFGVVSVKFSFKQEDTNSYSFGAFTNVTNYITWLKSQLN